jgi:uncharacterized membrane protein
MMARIADLAPLAAVLGTGLVAGVFFAFSTFVMPALARLPAEQGIAAMQSINVTAVGRWLMGALFGTAAICLAVGVLALAHHDAPGARLRLVGCAAYLLGTIVVTIACNVPRNDMLAGLVPDALDAAAAWHRYVREWMAWNHVRTVSSSVAAALLLLGR